MNAAREARRARNRAQWARQARWNIPAGQQAVVRLRTKFQYFIQKYLQDFERELERLHRAHVASLPDKIRTVTDFSPCSTQAGRSSPGARRARQRGTKPPSQEPSR